MIYEKRTLLEQQARTATATHEMLDLYLKQPSKSMIWGKQSDSGERAGRMPPAPWWQMALGGPWGQQLPLAVPVTPVTLFGERESRMRPQAALTPAFLLCAETALRLQALGTPAWRPPPSGFIFRSHFLFLAASDTCCPVPAVI